eukprot:473200-Rhodomonas_salina.3
MGIWNLAGQGAQLASWHPACRVLWASRREIASRTAVVDVNGRSGEHIDGTFLTGFRWRLAGTLRARCSSSDGHPSSPTPSRPPALPKPLDPHFLSSFCVLQAKKLWVSELKARRAPVNWYGVPGTESAACLRAHYGVSGTEAAYGTTRLRSSASRLWLARYWTLLASYARAMRCPVLDMAYDAILLSACYAMSGAILAYDCMCVGACYAVRHWPYLAKRLLYDVRYYFSTLSGTDAARGVTSQRSKLTSSLPK